MYFLQPVGRNKNYIVKPTPNYLTIFLAIIAIVIISTLPIEWGNFTDRENYALTFKSFQENSDNINNITTDNIFYLYTYLVSKITDYNGYFFITALIYIGNYFLAAKRMSKNYHYIIMLMILTSFMFYSYGTNTIRAGFAFSFIILALTYYNNLWKMLILMFIGLGCHFSMIIPITAILLSKYFDKTKFYFILWCLSIPVSAIAGNYFEVLFTSFSTDHRVQYLLTTDTHYNVGFRIDFILYSCLPMFLGYYYIYKKNFKSKFYKLVYNSFILANIFWLLVIRANFSDRFAYLSWFLIPILIIYPLISNRIVRNQNRKICWALFLQLIFTYTMYLR